VCRVLRGSAHEVRFRDLCAEGFDPLLGTEEIPEDGAVPTGIQEWCEELRRAEGIVVVHPNWWGQPPAVMKGWIDRVFRPGVAYRFKEGDDGEGVPIGLLRARAALVLNTSNTPETREDAVFGDPLDTLWKNCIFGLFGVRVVRRRMFGVVVTSTAAQRERWLTEAGELALELFGRDGIGASATM